MYYKSSVVDTVIGMLEIRMKHEGKHLLKTDTIIRSVSMHINLADDLPEREELLIVGIKQVIQSRLYVRGYFSMMPGYFVNVADCDKPEYLQLVINNKDNVIETKVKARNRMKELLGLDGQMVMIPDENNILHCCETKTKEELTVEIEADAV